MSFQMEVSAGLIHLRVHGPLGPPEVALLRDALAPLLKGRPRDLQLELVGRPELDAGTRAALRELQTFVNREDRRLNIVHTSELLPDPSQETAGGGSQAKGKTSHQ